MLLLWQSKTIILPQGGGGAKRYSLQQKAIQRIDDEEFIAILSIALRKRVKLIDKGNKNIA